ncbi:MAG: TolC family protein [Muribaculaceae bacterium]|nr:TolC family protein [Muribaculaceae bacterium]
MKIPNKRLIGGRLGAMALLLLSLPFAAHSAESQFADILREIERNNPSLALYGRRTEASKLANHTDLAPENPEVEFGLLPSTMGEGMRKDVAVTQSFDFPTAYGKRSKLAGARDNRDDARLNAERMEILHEAEDCCIELVYLNSILDLRSRQISYMRGVEEAYGKKLKAGETTRIEYNKAKLRVVTLESEYNEMLLERGQLLERLKVMNGGQSLELKQTSYSELPPIPSDFAQWLSEAEASNPAMKALRSEVEVARKDVEVNKAQGLPKLSLGYVGEFTPVEGYQGVKIGVSIPLWANRNKVKQARAELAAAEQEVEDARLSYASRMQFLIEKAHSLQKNLATYSEALEAGESEQLLEKAFKAGEISVGDYYQELEYYNEAYGKLMETERDLRLTLSELNAHTL